MRFSALIASALTLSFLSSPVLADGGRCRPPELRSGISLDNELLDAIILRNDLTRPHSSPALGGSAKTARYQTADGSQHMALLVNGKELFGVGMKLRRDPKLSGSVERWIADSMRLLVPSMPGEFAITNARELLHRVGARKCNERPDKISLVNPSAPFEPPLNISGCALSGKGLVVSLMRSN